MEYHLSPRYSHDFRDMLSKEKNILRFGITSTGKTLEEYSVNIPLVPNELELEELRKFRMKERMG